MTIKEVKIRYNKIKSIMYDDEAAHSAEDNLYMDVLQHIANGGSDAVEIAKIALETKNLDFSRWCG